MTPTHSTAQPPHRTAAIVSIGDELTLGQALDTNSQRISATLLDSGIRVVEHATLDDDEQRIAAAIARLASATDLVVITGGLGPTADDLTRQALAAAMGEPMVEDAESLAQIEAWYASRSLPMPATNRVQALRPASARALKNEHGTAPGLAAVVGDADVFCLPGPPREMLPMFDGFVRPALRLSSDRVVRTRVLKTFGLGESEIARRLGDAMDRQRQPLIGTTASMGIVSIRMRYEGPPDDADAQLGEAEAIARRVVDRFVIGEGDDPIGEHTRRFLSARSQTLCTAESCTGGLIAKLVTDVADASAVFVGGAVTYTNELKQRLVDVPSTLFNTDAETTRPGAVSRPVAEAMALGARERFGTGHALAATGIAGPGGGVPEKPVGTVWLAHASDRGVEARRFAFRGDRIAIRTWAAHAALGMLLLDGRIPADEPLVAEWPE